MSDQEHIVAIIRYTQGSGIDKLHVILTTKDREEAIKKCEHIAKNVIDAAENSSKRVRYRIENELIECWDNEYKGVCVVVMLVEDDPLSSY
jgi:hypothetical protein